jgi:hypothetical protein
MVGVTVAVGFAVGSGAFVGGHTSFAGQFVDVDPTGPPWMQFICS